VGYQTPGPPLKTLLFLTSTNYLRMIPTGTISEILNHKGTNVYSIAPDAMVFDAIQLMSDKNVGALLVIDRGRLIGILSERDYTRKVALKGKSSKQTPVREILSGQVIRISPSHSIEDCMRLMTEHRIRHLPVLNGDEIMGIISIGDLVNWIISAQTNTIYQLQTYISGYPT
jgi:CBS domain-containing protein